MEQRFSEAHRFIQSTLTLFGEIKAEVYRGLALMTLGDIFRAESEYSQAETAYRDAFSVLSKTNNQRTLAEILFRLSANAQAQRNPARAAMLFSVADTLVWRLEISLPDPLNHVDVETLHQQLSPEAWNEIASRAAEIDSTVLADYINQSQSDDSRMSRVPSGGH